MSGKSNNAGIYNFDNLNAQTLYIRGKIFQEYLDELDSGLTEAEITEVKSLLEYLDITGLNTAWSVTNTNINETLRSAITALQTKLTNIDTTGLTTPSVLTDANKNSALLTAIGTLITDLTALAVRVTTEEGNVDNLQTKTANLDTTGITSPSILNDANKNSVLKTALDALANTPGDVTALDGRVTTAEGDIDALEGRATAVENRATAVEGRATTLEGKTRFTTTSSTYFDVPIESVDVQPHPFNSRDGNTFPIGSFKMEVGPTLNQAGEGKSYFEITHKNLVQDAVFLASSYPGQSAGAYLSMGIRSYYRKNATAGIYDLNNETFLQHTDENGDGRVTMKAKIIRILPNDTNSIVEIGRFTEGVSHSDIRIGGRGNQINIGSMQNDELGQGVGDTATKTRIYIGRRPDPITEGNIGDVLNSQLILRGDCFTGNLNFKNLSVTSAINAQSIYAALNAASLPLFMLQNALTGGIFAKSDVVVMKAGLGGLIKRGDIETTNELSIDKLSIINQSVGNITPGVTFFFAQQNYSCTHLIGDNKTNVFMGDIILKNHNSLVAAFDILTEDNDKCNVLSIKGNSGILLHQGASSNNESLDIFNSKSGPIRLFIGADGTRAGTTHGGVYIMRYLEPFGNNLVATGDTKVLLGSRIGIDSSLASEAYQGDGFGQGKVASDGHLVIEVSTKVDTLRRQGVNVRHKTIVNNLPVYTQSIINSDSISTPSVEADSLKITNNYGGSTTQRLYKDANNKLYWNGEQISAVNYPLGAPTNQNFSNTYIDNNYNLYGNSDAGFPKQSALPTTYTGTIRTASTEAELTSAIATAIDYDIIRITANITLTSAITIAKKLKIEGTSNAIVVTFSTAVTIFTITNSEVWFSALTLNNANTGSSAVILTFSSSSAIKNYVAGCIFQTNEFAISSNNNNIQITDNIFEFVGSADSHRYVILSGCLGSCFINNNTFRGNGGSSTQCININNAVASAFLNGKIIISGNVSATNPVQRLLMVDISLTASNVSFYVSRNTMQTTSGFIILFALPFDGIKEFYVVQNTETLGSGITGGKGIIGIDSASNSTISFNTIVYSSGNSPAVLRVDYANLVNASANQNGVISYATSRFTPGATTYSVIVPFIVNINSLETQTLGAVMTLGNTASTTLNMNNNGITNVASIQGWNVKDITAGTNISATANAGNYTIANTAPVQNVLAGTGGISVTMNGTTATINHIGLGQIGGGGGGETIHDLNALEEVGAFQQRSTWGTNWAITDAVVNLHLDMYCSVDGKVIASASPGPGSVNAPVRFSTNYGTTFANGNISIIWRSITGTSSGSKLFATGYLAANVPPYLYYTSTDQGATWTNNSITSVTNQNPAPVLNRIRANGDGTYLIMCDESTQTSNGGRIFVSANGGSSWTAKTLTHSAVAFTRSCAFSRSGRYQYALLRASNHSSIHRSDNFGVTWTFMFNDSAIIGDNASFDKLECDSTGRYVYATRFDISNPSLNKPMYQSVDFGANWSASPLVISMTDVWVSATGQHVGAVATPQGGATRFYYSVDYGRTYSNVILTTTGAFRCLAGSGDGSTLVLGSINTTDFGQTSDGKIRVARQIPLEIVTTGLNESAMINGIMNITPNQQLWARGEGYQTGANGIYICPFNNATKINLSEYNLEYKIEFYWAPGTLAPAHFNYLGLNNVTSTDTAYAQGSNGGFTATTNMEFLHTPAQVDNKGSFIGRSYAGYQQNISSTSLTFRHATILSGKLSMNHRPENAPAYGPVPAGTGTLNTHDWGVFSRVLKNEFLCDNFTCVIANGNYPFDWGIVAPSNIDYPFSFVSVRGNSVWDMTYGGIFYAGGVNSIQNGLFQMFIMNADNDPNTRRPRNAYMKYQIYRIRK